jgi:inhibitor of cysteine peptidase
VLLLAFLAVAAVAAPMAASMMVPDSYGSADLKHFTSYTDLLLFVQANSATAQSWVAKGGQPGVIFNAGITGALTSLGTYSASTSDAVPAPYSITNVQVSGVDEADIVKTDGSYIYMVRGNSYGIPGEVAILQGYPVSDARILARLNWTEGKSPTQLFINGDKLVVFVSVNPYSSPYLPRSEVDVFNVRDRASPVLVRNITVDGSYVGSRMIGDYVYVISTSPAYVQNGGLPLPTIISGKASRTVAASDVYYSKTTDVSYAFTTIVAFDAKDDLSPYNSQTILMGSTSVIYVSTSSIYLAITNYGSLASTLSSGLRPAGSSPSSGEDTLLYRISIAGGKIEAAAQGSVRGVLLNQFSLDEYKGYLRVATTSWSNNQGAANPWEYDGKSNNVYVLDSTLGVVGKIEGMAPGESIYSARFMGDTGYVVTFQKVDPLFVINLADPQNPKVLGWLKTPGFSDYLQPLDQNHVLGIGKDAAPSEQGGFAWYQGMKLSVFDVTNLTSPVETSTFYIGDRGTTSPALTDQKAVLYDSSRNLLVIPVTVAKVDPSQYGGQVPASAYGSPVWQGAYVLNVSPSAGISLNGTVTHIAGKLTGTSADYNLYIQRSLYIGDLLYTISNGQVRISSLQGLATVATITLP